MTNADGAVLIADDDEYFRLALAALLRGPLGISTVEETGSLDEALSRLAETPGGISLALFDLSMPGMEGPGTLSAVRECYPDIRVAVVSASQSRQDVLTSLETGVHGYIPKGLGPHELVRALKIIISGEIFVPAFLADAPFSGAQQPGGSAAASNGLLARNPASQNGDVDAIVAAMSPRQREALALLVKGYSNKQIASELSLGEGTVKVHVAAVLRNLGVSNRAAAAALGAVLLRS
jgi:DNA-binding NarL/FixJ family response regulator